MMRKHQKKEKGESSAEALLKRRIVGGNQYK